MVLNTTFNNISAMSVFFVEGTGVPGEFRTLVVICTDCKVVLNRTTIRLQLRRPLDIKTKKFNFL
jgi:hypothetical protein